MRRKFVLAPSNGFEAGAPENNTISGEFVPYGNVSEIVEEIKSTISQQKWKGKELVCSSEQLFNMERFINSYKSVFESI